MLVRLCCWAGGCRIPRCTLTRLSRALAASSYISGSIALDKQTLASLTPARKVDFVLGLANATQLPSSQIAVVGAEETIQEFLRVRFTIQSTDPAVRAAACRSCRPRPASRCASCRA